MTTHSIPLKSRDESQDLSQKRYRSERRDRIFARRALRRGVPIREIEARLIKASEFHHLNPGRDAYAYVRNVLEEEGSSIRKLDLVDAMNPESQVHPEKDSNDGREVHSEKTARRYIQENFEPSDRLAVVVRNRDIGETLQRITTAQNLASPDYQAWLRHKNAHGSDIYVSLNTLNENARGRTKQDLKEIRHVYLDLDSDGKSKLATIYEDPSIPHPNYVLNTSDDKYQVVWRVEGIARADAESLLKILAARYGGDPAATDATRVFRLPGFNNKKYKPDFPVRLNPGALPSVLYQRSDFKMEAPDRSTDPAEQIVAGSPQSDGSDLARTQSERDWAFAIRHLGQGDNPKDVVRRIAEYRSTDHNAHGQENKIAPRKTNPEYYASHTVDRAMEHLGMQTTPDKNTEMKSPTAEPDR